MMRIFISYARADKQIAESVVQILNDGGHSPWYDNKIIPGQDWQKQLLNSIEKSNAFIYLLTPKSIESKYCRWEFAEAVRMGKPIIPMMMKATRLPEPLDRYQYIDATDGLSSRNVATLFGALNNLTDSVIPAEEVTVEIPPLPEISREKPVNVRLQQSIISTQRLGTFAISATMTLLGAIAGITVEIWGQSLGAFGQIFQVIGVVLIIILVSALILLFGVFYQERSKRQQENVVNQLKAKNEALFAQIDESVDRIIQKSSR